MWSGSLLTGRDRRPETEPPMVVRYVGIDLLLTTSPLYDPLVTAPDVGGAKVALVARLENDTASSGLGFINVDFTKRELRRFEL